MFSFANRSIVRSGDAIYVRVGDHDLTRKYGSPGAQTLRVATTYIHHNHNSQTLDNDIALLKLHGQAELKDGVCLVCLPARGVNHAAGKRCTVTGYGYMGEAGPIPLRIREAEIPVVSDAECIRKINAVTEKIFILPASSFCAGGEAGNDACQVSSYCACFGTRWLPIRRPCRCLLGAKVFSYPLPLFWFRFSKTVIMLMMVWKQYCSVSN